MLALSHRKVHNMSYLTLHIVLIVIACCSAWCWFRALPTARKHSSLTSTHSLHVPPHTESIIIHVRLKIDRKQVRSTPVFSYVHQGCRTSCLTNSGPVILEDINVFCRGHDLGKLSKALISRKTISTHHAGSTMADSQAGSLSTWTKCFRGHVVPAATSSFRLCLCSFYIPKGTNE